MVSKKQVRIADRVLHVTHEVMILPQSILRNFRPLLDRVLVERMVAETVSALLLARNESPW